MNPALTLYGIRNCSSVKKALQWLQTHGLETAFHDYKKSAIDHARLQAWAAQLDNPEQLLNKRGTTWRRLPPGEQARLQDGQLLALLAEHPSLIRRPVLERADGSLLIGFDEALWQDTLLEHKP